jgi:UDP-glucuronate decarboxylase
LNLDILEEDLREIVKLDLPWYDLEGCTVVVTGAAGFIPAYLVETLLFLNKFYLTRRIQVLGLVRNLEKARTKFAHHANRQDLNLVEHDVTSACVQIS